MPESKTSLLMSGQFRGEQVRFDRKIMRPLHVSVIGSRLGLLHVAFDLLDCVLLARGELTARDCFKVLIAGGQ